MAAERKKFGFRRFPLRPHRLVVDSAPPTCKHAIHEISESTSFVLHLVAPLTARGPEKM